MRFFSIEDRNHNRIRISHFSRRCAFSRQLSRINEWNLFLRGRDLSNRQCYFEILRRNNVRLPTRIIPAFSFSHILIYLSTIYLSINVEEIKSHASTYLTRNRHDRSLADSVFTFRWTQLSDQYSDFGIMPSSSSEVIQNYDERAESYTLPLFIWLQIVPPPR